jgi:hypothetical protein
VSHRHIDVKRGKLPGNGPSSVVCMSYEVISCQRSHTVGDVTPTPLPSLRCLQRDRAPAKLQDKGLGNPSMARLPKTEIRIRKKEVNKYNLS